MLLSVVHMPDFFRISLLTGTLKPDCTVDNFPEYATDLHKLDNHQRILLKNFALSVLRSVASPLPIRVVMAVGHADTALRLNGAARTAMELDVSAGRGRSGAAALREELGRLAGHSSAECLLSIRNMGIGAAIKVVQNAATEQQMRKNRRVEFYALKEDPGPPSCGGVQ